MTRPYAIPKRLVWEAFQRVKTNGGASGVDAESIADFEKKLGDNLYKLWSRMESGSYFPPPVKAVPIPKTTQAQNFPDFISATSQNGSGTRCRRRWQGR